MTCCLWRFPCLRWKQQRAEQFLIKSSNGESWLTFSANAFTFVAIWHMVSSEILVELVCTCANQEASWMLCALVLICVHYFDSTTLECNILYFNWPWELIGFLQFSFRKWVCGKWNCTLGDTLWFLGLSIHKCGWIISLWLTCVGNFCFVCTHFNIL